jgi:hypothetical protein
MPKAKNTILDLLSQLNITELKQFFLWPFDPMPGLRDHIH